MAAAGIQSDCRDSLPGSINASGKLSPWIFVLRLNAACISDVWRQTRSERQFIGMSADPF